jgi:two-component system sensor histidine kinase/response regulator
VSHARSSWRAAFAVFVGAVTVLFLAQQVGRGTYLFTDVLSPKRVAVVGSLAKLAPQLIGSVFALRCARRCGKENAARWAWLLMSAWLGSWFIGQAVLGFYERVLDVPAPVPSLGDAFFIAGCVFESVGLFAFARAYRRSGLAAGSARQDALIALGACAAFGVVGYVVLLPVALGPGSLAGRVVNLSYPAFDLVTLIPTLVLLRVTLGFRGGHVWRVWAALLAGILFATGGDVVFSDLTPAHLENVGPLADLLFILGYSFCAYGMGLQYALMEE